MSPGKRRISFKGLTAPDAPSRSITSLMFSVTAASGVSHDVNLTNLPASPMAHAVAEALLIHVPERRVSRRDVATLSRELTRFVELATARDPSITVETLTVKDVEDYVGDCQARRGKKGWYTIAKDTLCCLKVLSAQRFASPTWQRLQRVDPRKRKAKTTPREAYSRAVATAIRKACLVEMREVLRRITDEGPTLVSQGRDPRECSEIEAFKRENVVWLANELGPMNKAQWRTTLGVSSARYNTRSAKKGVMTPVSAQQFLYPTARDLLPFHILFLLKTGLNPASALGLPTNCLEQEGNGRFTLSYEKMRANGKVVRERYDDRGLATPGGIIRAVVTITERLRRHVPSTALWWATTARNHPVNDKRARVPPYTHVTIDGIDTNGDGSTPDQLDLFCAQHSLTDTDGSPLRLRLSRLRKTYKVDQTRRTGGQLESLTRDHTVDVHLGHYATVAVAVPIYRQITYNVMKEARPSKTRSHVLTSAEIEAAKADPSLLAVRTQRSLPIIKKALNTRALQMWMCTCLGFLDSPFAPAGEPCPASPLAECLDCHNGLISPEQLPAIMSFMNHMLKQRTLMRGDDWAAVYADRYTKACGVLAYYSTDELIEAKTLAASREGELLYIGAELRQYGHLEDS